MLGGAPQRPALGACTRQRRLWLGMGPGLSSRMEAAGGPGRRRGRGRAAGFPGQLQAGGGERLRVCGSRAPSRGHGLTPPRAHPLRALRFALGSRPVPLWGSRGAGRAAAPPPKGTLQRATVAPLCALPGGGGAGQRRDPRSLLAHPAGRPAAGPSPGRPRAGSGPWQPSPFLWEGGGLGHQTRRAETNKGRRGSGPAPAWPGLPREPNPGRPHPLLPRHPHPLSQLSKARGPKPTFSTTK